MEDVLILMEIIFVYVNQDGCLKIVLMVIKKIFFLEFLEKNLYKILIEVVFKCKSNDLLFNVMKCNCYFLLQMLMNVRGCYVRIMGFV